MTTKMNTEVVKDMFETIKKNTVGSPFIKRTSKFFEQAEAKGLKSGFEFGENEEDAENKNINVIQMVNKLVKFFGKIVTKIADHAKTIKFNTEMTEAVKNEVDDLKEKQKQHFETIEKLKVEGENMKEIIAKSEYHCDEIQQRSMKGNLTISSPNTRGKDSLAIRLPKGNRAENDTEMCLRLIRLKTGVEAFESDISACHVLKREGANSSFIIRFHNRRPGSAWEVIAAGLLTGKNSASGNSFTDANVYINFQLTKKRGDLSKVVRDAKFKKQIIKYGTDQNGRITIRVAPDSPWTMVTSPSHLSDLIAHPPAPKPRQGAWNGQRQ